MAKSILVSVTASGNLWLASSWPSGTLQPTAATASAAGAAPISRIGRETFALVTSTSVNGTNSNNGVTATNTGVTSGVILPKHAKVKDTVVVYLEPLSGGYDSGVAVWVPDGDYVAAVQNGYFTAPGVFQLVAPGVWYPVP